jgi:tRNA pseudouridine38-40 synthase
MYSSEVQRYCATVEYDGTDFFGYQLQPKVRTVQGEIEVALAKITQTDVRVDAAGRTDAGVHAVGQVIAFDVIWKHELRVLHRALNAVLPKDIVVTTLKVAPLQFSPRFNALSRSYRYTIINRAWPSVLQCRYACHVKHDLDVAMMSEASGFLIGSHDFASFGNSPGRGKNTVRRVMQAEWSVVDSNVVFDVTANAFLYRMVRNIVGTLLQVGLGKLDLQQFQKILMAKNLSCSAPAAPACGLCLMKVVYPKEMR